MVINLTNIISNWPELFKLNTVERLFYQPSYFPSTFMLVDGIENQATH
jgi:hypothetical protein